MSLETKDIELIEKLIYKHGDDLGVIIARSFQRLEDRLEDIRGELSDELSDVKSEVRDVLRFRDRAEMF